VLYFYWLTNANGPGGYVDHDIIGIGPPWTGTQNYFNMWPVSDGGSSCHFETRVVGPASSGYPLLRTNSVPVSTNITNFDPQFCQGVLNEVGYVTAGTKVSPNVNFAAGAHDSFKLDLGAIYIGK